MTPTNALHFFGITALLLLFAAVPPASAQQHFEGQLRFQFNDLTDGSQEEMTMLVKENRVRFLGSLENYADMPMLASGLTLRADENDMLLFSEDKKVVVLNMRELGGFLNQMTGGSNAEESPASVPETQLERGSEERSFHGMQAGEYILSSTENPADEIRIWASEELYIDWETLISPVAELSRHFDGGINISGIQSLDWPMELTPLYAEMYRDGELQNTIELTDMEARSFQNNELDIPEGYQPVSLFELMMQQN